MALFDFLTPKWSAGKMSEDDRRRMLWSIKQITSYTAWMRCRDRYALFVDLMERQCKEEPVGRLSEGAFDRYRVRVQQWVRDGEFPKSALNNLEDDHRTEWDSSTYADVLRGLALYDKGLARLKQGDRSVFKHNSQGLLEDAFHCADRYFEYYYQGGPKGDGMVFYGKYVAAMKAALLWASEHGGFNAGGLEPAMANLSAPSVWRESRRVRMPGGGDRWVIGTHESLLEETAHLKELAPVPQAGADVAVRSGDACPVFGVYEPQIKDGLMVYMCQGQEAYRYGEPLLAPGAGQPVVWRLIWADDRYLDGSIPPEEGDYFFGEEPPPDFTRFAGEELVDEKSSDQVITAPSGRPAPLTGTWAAVGDLSGRVFWKKGDALPQLRGHDVEWVYAGV
jgi:hypothetical protein